MSVLSFVGERGDSGGEFNDASDDTGDVGRDGGVVGSARGNLGVDEEGRNFLPFIGEIGAACVGGETAASWGCCCCSTGPMLLVCLSDTICTGLSLSNLLPLTYSLPASSFTT